MIFIVGTSYIIVVIYIFQFTYSYYLISILRGLLVIFIVGTSFIIVVIYIFQYLITETFVAKKREKEQYGREFNSY